MTDASIDVLDLTRAKYWGRKIARPLKPLQKQLLEEDLPSVELQPKQLREFCLTHPCLYLEIGYGGGEHLVEQAIKNEKATFIGCEPFLHGAVHILEQRRKLGFRNVYLMTQDARLALIGLNDESLDGCFILFADPWPKKRHHKRRMVCDETLDHLFRVLKPNGTVRIATDHEGYQEWIKEIVGRRTDFNTHLFTTTHPDSWPITRYEKKAMDEEKTCHYYELKKAN